MNDAISRSAVLALTNIITVKGVDFRCIFPEEVKHLPILDVEQVVRCKDCKHHRTDNCPMRLNDLAYCDEGRGGYSVYMQTKDNTSDDGFCHLGVRMGR